MIFKITNQEKQFTPRITGMKRAMCSHRKAPRDTRGIKAIVGFYPLDYYR